MIKPRQVKWGIIFFVVTLGWMLLEKLMGWHGPWINQHAQFSNLYDGVFVAVFALAFWENRRKAVTNKLGWVQGFLFGLGITLIVTALSPLTQTIIHKVISPEFFPNVIRLAVDNEILTQAAAEAKFNLRNYIFENLVGTFVLGICCTSVLAFVFRKTPPAATTIQ
ncbi:MAG: DUF4199 domain-containing protein [Lewinellaceae bacterium]|nr:DUF4199 domain-containing protein [Lewinellaceae bacterium]